MVTGFCFPFCFICCLTGRAGLGSMSARGRRGMGHEPPYPTARPVTSSGLSAGLCITARRASSSLGLRRLPAEVGKQMSDVPADFPQDPWPAAVAGAKPKSPARLIDGKFVLGLTDEKRLVNYELCSDLVMQLLAYCKRKKAEQPHEAGCEVLGRVETNVRNKGWNVWSIEISWVMACLEKQP